MSENPPKKRSFLSSFFYACIVIFAVVVLTAYEVDKEDRVNQCLQETYKVNKARWARQCKETVKRELRQLKDCIEERKAIIRSIYSSSDDVEKQDKVALIQCRRMYGESDSSADCLLPKDLADSLNSQSEKAVEMCKS